MVAPYRTPSEFAVRYIDEYGFPGAYPGVKNPQIHPTNLRYPTAVMGWKVLGWSPTRATTSGGSSVEIVGLPGQSIRPQYA